LPKGGGGTRSLTVAALKTNYVALLARNCPPPASDNMKMADFKTEVLFDLVDSLYRQKHGLTVAGNYSMHDLRNFEMSQAVLQSPFYSPCLTGPTGSTGIPELKNNRPTGLKG
jgi:hypothetical protein